VIASCFLVELKAFLLPMIGSNLRQQMTVTQKFLRYDYITDIITSLTTEMSWSWLLLRSLSNMIFQASRRVPSERFTVKVKYASKLLFSWRWRPTSGQLR
jgi:hypothetical protein